MCEHLSNTEALMNIGANLSEIVGIAGGFNCVLWGWMPFAGGLKGATKKLEILGLIVATGALATPGIVNLAASINTSFGLLASGLLAIVMVGSGGYLFISPGRLAIKTKHPKQKLIMTLNSLFFIPFVFPIAMAILSFSGKEQRMPLGGPAILGCHEEHDPH